MKRVLILLVLSLVLRVPLKADIHFIAVKDLATWEEMLNLAFSANRNLIVYMQWQGCQNCREVVKNTFSDKELGDWVAENTLALALDIGTELGANVAEMYQIETYPTLLLINAGEIRFETIDTFTSGAALLKTLQKANEQATRYPEWKKQAAAGSLAKLDYIQFVRIEYKNNRITPDHPIIRDLATTLDSADFSQAEILAFVQDLCVDVDGPVYKTLVQKPNWITDTLAFSWNTYKKNVFDYAIYRAVSNQDSILLEDLIVQMGRLQKGETLKNFALRARQTYAAELGHWATYDTLVQAYLAPFPADSANLYHDEAIFLMENYDDKTANNLALKYIKQGLAKKETFLLYYTLSLWLYQNNDLTNSYKAAYMAENRAATTEEKNMARQIQMAIENYY